MVARFIGLGVVPKSAYLLTTRGRRSGQLRTNPVQIVRHDGQCWL
ncbi:MAG: nitroreductase/quinone reductase family protein, partial [Actinomycetota bacterium]